MTRARIFFRCVRVTLLVLHPILWLLQKAVIFLEINSSQSAAEELSPVFIVGAPRCGSTILYQAITKSCNIGYIDNLSCIFCKTLALGLWISRWKYKGQPHNSFNSDLGCTIAEGGLRAPSECGEFWYRWLPRDMHFQSAQGISSRDCGRLKRAVSEAVGVLSMPIIFKNLNNGQRLQLMRSVFPKSRIIYIRRDPVFIAHSILRARQKLGIKAGCWWSVKPINYRDLIGLPEKELVLSQVHYLTEQIEKDLLEFDSDQVKTVEYNTFSKEKIAEVVNWLSLEIRDDAKLPEFRSDKVNLLDNNHLELEKLYIELFK